MLRNFDLCASLDYSHRTGHFGVYKEGEGVIHYPFLQEVSEAAPDIVRCWDLRWSFREPTKKLLPRCLL